MTDDEILSVAILDYMQSGEGEPDLPKCKIDTSYHGAMVKLLDTERTLLATYSYVFKSGKLNRTNLPIPKLTDVYFS